MALPLAPANRDNPAWLARLSGDAMNECAAHVFERHDTYRWFAWCVVYDARDLYRDGVCASRAAAQRLSETTARKFGLRPALCAEPSKRFVPLSRPFRLDASGPSYPALWVDDPIFRVVLADEPAELAAWEAKAGRDRVDAVNWFMGTCWGDAAVCREAERKPFCSDADRLAALRAAFRAEGISLPTSKC